MIKRILELQIFNKEKGYAWMTAKHSENWLRAQKTVDEILKGIPGSSNVYKINLDGPKLAQQAEAIRQLIKVKKLANISRAELEEEAVAGPDGADWYELVPRVELHDQGSTAESVPRISANHIRPGVHAVIIIGAPPVVSDAFKQLVEKKKFKGLDFVTLPERGKREAMPWYLPIPLKPIGRGLDHDFFDPAKLKQAAKAASNWMTAEPRWRTGVERLDFNSFKSDFAESASVSPEAKQLLSMIPGKMLRVSSVRRYLRKFLPRNVDFAFSWTGPDSPPERGHLVSSRELCVSRRAMQALVDAKLVGVKEFKPLEILDKPPVGVKVLDKPNDTLPGPIFEGEWRERIAASEKERLAKATGSPKPKAAPRSAEVLNLLQKKRSEEGFKKPATATAIDQAEKKLGVPLPEFWRQVLLIADGFELPPIEALSGAAVSFDSTKELRSSLQKDMLAEYTEITGKKSQGLIYLGNTIWGDMFFLRAGTGADRQADAPIMLLSHETGEPMSNWPSAATMLNELLSS